MAAAETPPPTAVTTAQDGPLRQLANKAAASPLVRRAAEKVPTFASQAVSNTASKAEAVLTHVDSKLAEAGKQLDTDEGRRLKEAASSFWESGVLLAALLCGLVLSGAERLGGVQYEEGEVPAGMERVKRVVGVGVAKVNHKFECREKETEGGVDVEIYKKGKWVGVVMLSVVTCVVKALKEYEGPASDYVAPLAQRVFAVLPEGTEETETVPETVTYSAPLVTEEEEEEEEE